MRDAQPRNVVDVLSSMVSIESVNPGIGGPHGGEARLAEYLSQAASDFGLAARGLPVPGYGENLLVSIEVDPERPWILFDSHLDTVVVEGMSIEPFAAEIRDGKLWGRGACDTKGSGAAMLWALHEYAAAAERPNNIGILYSLDEEVGMRGIRSFLDHDYPAFGAMCRGIVVGEPTRMKPVTAHNGIFRLRAATGGVAAHASNPSAGRSAITAMVTVVTELEAGYIASLEASSPFTGAARCSINTIHGGTASNIIPDRCEIEIDRRMVPGEEPAAVVDGLRGALAEIARNHPGIELESEALFVAPPLAPKEGSPLASLCEAALRGEGMDATGQGATYATNGGDASARGIDTVVLGPGDIAQAHTRDEWIDLDELGRSVAVYRRIMASP